jgi:hypothetical protein
MIAEDITDRSERMKAIQALIDAYIDSVGETPDDAQLERLTDYILREELTDGNEYKITHGEYPFMSERQFERRHEREYSLKLAEDIGADGMSYSAPVRRHRTAKETRFIDKYAKSRNKERAAQYRKDTAAGEVVAYNLRDTGGVLADEFVQCRGITYNAIPEYYR